MVTAMRVDDHVPLQADIWKLVIIIANVNSKIQRTYVCVFYMYATQE